MLKNMKVGTKLIAVLVAPVLVLVILASIGVSQRLDTASSAQRVEQLSEMAYQGGIGQQLRPIRTGAGIFGVAHKVEKFPGNFGYAFTRLKQDVRGNKMTIVIRSGNPSAVPGQDSG